MVYHNTDVKSDVLAPIRASVTSQVRKRHVAGLCNGGFDTGSARIDTVFGAVELAGDESSIPSQDEMK